jgi:Zn-finger nucleic acid-binding protein
MYLKCPACTQDLTPYTDDLTKLVIDGCFYCGGMWFDEDELRKLFTSPKLRSKFLFPTDTFKVKIKDAPEVRKCCRCEDQALQGVDTGDITVDECPECHGIWLDAGEILRLVERFDKGEFDKKCLTEGEIKWGRFDQSVLGQIARMLMLAFRKLLKL